MPLYMFQFAYTADAWAALASNPQDRSQASATLVQQLGGRLVSFYYTTGEYDGFLIYEAPDDATAAAVSISSNAAGHLRLGKTTRLYTLQEAMEAMRKAGAAPYQGPAAR